MTMPFYSSVDQLLRDRSELARKGIARGRSVVVLTYAGGVLFVAENHSPSLHKVSEIYDRIGFAAVGRYNEFETCARRGASRRRPRLLLRPARRHRSLAGQRLRPDPRALFIEQQKPFEVELCVAEVGTEPAARPALPDHLRRLDHRRAAVRGDGRADRADQLEAARRVPGAARGWPTPSAVAVKALQSAPAPGPASNGPAAARILGVSALEVAVLDRARLPRRAFRRITGATLRDLLPAENRGTPDADQETGGDDAPAASGAESTS